MQDSFFHSMGYNSERFLCQAGKGENVWPCVLAGTACARLCWHCSVALTVGKSIFMPGAGILPCLCTAKSKNTEKSSSSLGKEVNKEKDSY